MVFIDRLSWNQHSTIVLSIFIVFPFTALISSAIYLFVYFVSCFFPSFGRFLNYEDVWFDEDFTTSVPQNSIVATLTLKGGIELEELKTIFNENVLSAHSVVNPQKLRFPELKQFLTTFVCFRIWKNDPNFLIDKHIAEETWDGSELEDIHQKYQNKLFQKNQSPWEMVLIKNVKFPDDTYGEPMSLIVFRVHHVMADGKSVLKLIIECLGNKRLKTASSQNIQKTNLRNLFFILSYPLKIFVEFINLYKLQRNSFQHPWKLQECFRNPDYQTNKTVVAFSPKIKLSSVKQMAKENDVKTSAVVMGIIAGATRKYIDGKWNRKVATGFMLPKPNHPEYLTNHAYLSIIDLATDQECAFKRLQECNEEFSRIKNEQQFRYINAFTLLGGLQIYPVTKFLSNWFFATAITNNAGDMEGFSVGNAECVEAHASVGTLQGIAGVVFTALSHQDVLRIAVIAKESVLSKEIAQSLAKHLEYELELLVKSP